MHLSFKQKNKKNKDYKKISEVITKIIFHTFIIIIFVFYIRKIGHIIPGIGPQIDTTFKEGTTHEYTIHVSIFIALVELLPYYRKLYEKLNNELYDDV